MYVLTIASAIVSAISRRFHVVAAV